MFPFLMRMMVYPPRLCRCVIRAFFLIVAMSALVSCGHSVPTATATSNTLPAPPGLHKVFEIPGTGDTFTIKVYITGRPDPVVVNNLRLSADKTRIETFNVSLPEGRLELRLEYVVNVAGRDLVIAQTNAVERVFSAASPTIDFSGATLDYSNSDLNRDQDEDGWSTKDELTKGTEPFNPDSHPPGVPPAPVPQPPKNLRVDPGDGQLSLQWDAVEAADGYYVYFGTASDLSVDRYREQGGTRLTSQTNNYLLSGLGNGTTYYILITSRKGTQESVAVSSNRIPNRDSQPTYTINVSVFNLNGKLVLSNGYDDLTVVASGHIVFAGPLQDATPYSVTIKTQPIGQFCVVGGMSSGIINGADVHDIDVVCDRELRDVFAEVTGLTGGELILQYNGVNVDPM